MRMFDLLHPSAQPLPLITRHTLRLSLYTTTQTVLIHQTLHTSCSSHIRSNRSNGRNAVAAAAAAGDDDVLLNWSLNEEGTETLTDKRQSLQQHQFAEPPSTKTAAAAAAAAVPVLQQKQLKRQQQQQQHTPPTSQQSDLNDQQQPPKRRGKEQKQQHVQDRRPSASSNYKPVRPREQQQQQGRRRQQQPQQPQQPQRPTPYGLSNDAFLAAQLRVQQLLVSTDITRPEEAAQQLPDCIDELVIALQLLATAPRPKQIAALKQYEAATAALAAAVLEKLKRLLLQQWQQQAAYEAAPAADSSAPGAAAASSNDDGSVIAALSAALRLLPATKVAAVVFSLGVLRQYDHHLTLALEAATRQLLARAAFNANQLGQLGQGFAYLDHSLTPEWQQNYLMAWQRHLHGLKGTQIASLAEFLLKYRLQQYSATTYRLGSSHSTSTAPGPPAAALVAGPGALLAAPCNSSYDVVLPAVWLSKFLASAGSQAHTLKPKHLALVLAATAAIYKQQLQHQAAVAAAGDVSRLPACLAGLPAPVEQEAGNSSSSSGYRWLLSLLAAFQQLLPDMSMPYLAVALPALAELTVSPWPQQLLLPVLLQVRLLLPAAGGPEIVSAAAGAMLLARGGGQAAPVDAEWCDALLQRLHVLLPDLATSDLAAVIKTLALLRVRPYRAWVYELCARLRIETKSFSAAQTVDVIESLAALRIVLDPEVLHLFVLGIKRWMPLLGYRDLDRLSRGVRAMYPRVLPGRTVQQLVEELERRSKFLQLQQQQQEQKQEQLGFFPR